MSENIFNGETPPAVQNPDPVIPVIPQEAAEFVGEGKKYKSVEDALRSVPHAQKHILTLEEELAQAKEELAKRRTAEELLDEMRNGVTQPEHTTQSELDPSKVAQIVSTVIEQREIQKTADQNIKSVTTTFMEKFGDKAEEIYNKIAQETGMSVAALNRLSASSPTAVFKLAGLDNRQPHQPGKITGSVNTEGKTQVTPELSARVPRGATTKQVVDAWKIAGEKVKNNLN